MAFGDTPITLIGNLVEDPELRFTQIPRGFAISEAHVHSNPRVALSVGACLGIRFRN